MKPHRFLPLFAMLSLLTTGVATPDATGHLSAASVEAAGPSTTTADLTGLFVLHAPTPAFTLDADRLIVENHHANVSLMLQAPLGSRYNVNDNPRTLHDGPGLLTGHDNRPKEALWVLPLDGHAPPIFTASAADCVTVEPPDKDTVTARAFVNTAQPEWSVDTSRASGAAAWRTCQDATSTIAGDFLFVLWEWDARLTANGETRTLHTGHQDAYSGTPIDGAVGTADELFITVQGGTLTLPLAPGAHELYLHAPHVEGESWRFTDASGTLPVVGDVAGTVRVLGGLAATVVGSGAGVPLGADVEGRPVEVNGAPVTVTAPAAGISQTAVAVWVAFAAFAAVVAMFLLLWRRSVAVAVASKGDAGTEPGPGMVRRDMEAEWAVLRVVRRRPGVTVRELQQRAGVSKERAAAALDALLARGKLARRGSEARWHIFPPWPDLNARWRREVALKQEPLRLLLGLLHEAPGMEQPRVVAECRQRWGWAPSSTKRRLLALAEVGLA